MQAEGDLEHVFFLVSVVLKLGPEPRAASCTASVWDTPSSANAFLFPGSDWTGCPLCH